MTSHDNTGRITFSQRGIIETIAMFSVCLLLATVYGMTQPLIGYGGGYPNDALQYMRMAQQVILHEPIVAESPFVYRIGLPYLVGTLFPSDPLQGFRIANLVVGGLTLILLYALLLQFTRSRAVLLTVLILFVANPYSPLRYSHFYPALTDPTALLFMLAILYLNRAWPQSGIARAAVLSVLSMAGALFREIAVIAPLSLFCAEAVRLGLSGAWTGGWAKWSKAQWLTRVRLLILAALPVLAALVGVLLARQLVVAEGAYPASTMQIIRRNLSFPSVQLLSIFMSFGPVIVLVLINVRGLVWEHLRHRVELLACLVLLFVAQFVGGYHTDRHLYWTFMVIFPLIAILLERLFASPPSVARSALLVTLVLAQILASRAFSPIPFAPFDENEDFTKQSPASYLFFAAYGSDTTVAHVSAAGINEPQRLILLAQYVLFTVWAYVLCRQGRLFGYVPAFRKGHAQKAKGSEAS